MAFAELEAWADRRHADLRAREFDNALATIGPAKPLGAQGFPGILQAAKALFQHLGRNGRLRGPFGGMLRHGVAGTWWVYAWHEPALLALLRDATPRYLTADPSVSGRVLVGPTCTPREFVAWTRRQMYLPGTPHFDLIADAYGDRTGPGRSDVLPGVPRRTLLAAYEQRWGEPDPTSIYFAREDLPTRADFPRAPLAPSQVASRAGASCHERN